MRTAKRYINTKDALYGLFWIVMLVAITSTGVQCTGSNDPDGEESPWLNHNDSVKYVGIQVCSSCHLDIYKSFIRTGMGGSFGEATRSRSAADFTGHRLIYDSVLDLYYRPFWKKDSMYIEEFRLAGRDTVHKRTEKVSYIIGSGQHTNSHLMEVNGYLYQLPLTWYAQKKKWDLPPGFEQGRNVRFSREIGFECMSCHNALPAYIEGSGNRFASVPQGIDCERCHGPGELHVKEKLAGIKVDTAVQADYSIVNPRRLPWDRQTDICQRCHLQGNAVMKPGKTFSDFRPGKVLSDYMEVFMPVYKNADDEFIMASHAQRLKMSKCFKGLAKGEPNSLTCITCHNPHVSVKVTGKDVFNTACRNCHASGRVCTEKESVRNLSANNCWGCHMPKSGTIDIPHVTVTDHRIQIPVKKAAKQALKEFAGLYCVNNPLTANDTRAHAFLSYYETFEGEPESLDSAMKYLSASGNTSEVNALQVHLRYLRRDYAGIIRLAGQLNPSAVTDAWFCYRTGQAYQNSGDPQQAERWFERAVALAPDNLDFQNKLASALIQNGRIELAVEKLNLLLALNEKQAETYTNLGFALVNTQNFKQAMVCYNRALALEPDMQQALLNKAALCNLTGDKVQARKLLKQILLKDPQNQYIRQLYESI